MATGIDKRATLAATDAFTAPRTAFRRQASGASFVQGGCFDASCDSLAAEQALTKLARALGWQAAREQKRLGYSTFATAVLLMAVAILIPACLLILHAYRGR